jgi:preprotein translocase subunit SecY
MQLMTVIVPKFEALNKEGEAGRRTMTKWTRWITVPLAFIQSYGFLLLLGTGGINLIDLSFPGVLLPMLYVTAASMAIMWIGELITEHGIGNGISLIIFAGIIASMPSVVGSMFLAGSGRAGSIFLFLLVNVATLIAVVLFTDAHRLLPITYANQGAGRGVQGSLPLRLLQAGMIPIIFAISLVAFPTVLSQIITNAPRFAGLKRFIDTYLNTQNPSIVYMVVYFLLVVAFTYFYVSVTFKPGDIAESIQKRGGFIPGVRPGKATEEKIAKISSRLNLWGGSFLGLVAVIPLFFTKWGGLSSQDVIISGAGIIIIVGVGMELIRQVNAQLLAHDYEKLV